MTTYIQGAGPTAIFASSTPSTGAFIRVHPGIRNMTVQAVLTGSSVGSTESGVVKIAASNDGVTPLATLLGTITLSSLGSPACDGFAIDAHWEWIRAEVTSISTSTTSAINSSMSVYVSGHMAAQ